MRARVVILVLAILAVAGFAALNWSEIQRTAPLSFGLTVAEAPLGMILLGLLGIALIAFLLASAAHETRSMVVSRQHAKELEAQRHLAEKAEVSRFHDLRQQLDSYLKDMRDRDAIAATEYDKVMLQAQRDQRTQFDQLGRALMARMAEFEARLDGRQPRVDAADLRAADLAHRNALEREREIESLRRHDDTVVEAQQRADDLRAPPRQRGM